MQTRRMIFAAAAIAMISAVPASARHLVRHHSYLPSYSSRGNVLYPGGYHRGPDRYGVYFGNEEVARDPDPNVRQQLENDYSYLYSW